MNFIHSFLVAKSNAVLRISSLDFSASWVGVGDVHAQHPAGMPHAWIHFAYPSDLSMPRPFAAKAAAMGTPMP
jgi:hypothetical protein